MSLKPHTKKVSKQAKCRKKINDNSTLTEQLINLVWEGTHICFRLSTITFFHFHNDKMAWNIYFCFFISSFL